MSIESARKYAKSLEISGVFSANVNFCRLDAGTTNILIWERKDARVSKESFVVKLNMSSNIRNRSISIEHKKQKLLVQTRNIMGIIVNSENLVIRIQGKPDLLVKESSEWKQQYIITNLPVDITATITLLFGKNKSLPNYSELFQQDDFLNAALKAGIQDHYPGFSSSDTRPEHVLPVVKDPILVRAAQLAVLNFSQDERAHDIKWLIQMYSALYSAFKELLKSRLAISVSSVHSHEE